MKRYIVPVVVLVVFAACIVVALRHSEPKPEVKQEPPKATVTNSLAAFTNFTATNQMPKLKTRFSEFSDAEKEEFRTNFFTRYKPALVKWCNAFSGRVPFSPDAVTPDNLAERIGRNTKYREYAFVVNGITLGIQDTKGIARVDYLNDPTQTKKMNQLPDGSQAPIITPVITRDDLIKMMAVEGGIAFKPNDIRLTPTGYSGALNGGTIVNVGGNPDNAASWEYDMVFGSDGKLAYYLKPNH